MAAEWHKVFNMKGFDKDAAPRWQMVPVDGDRYMALRDGAGLTVTSTNTGIVTVTEINVHALPHDGERMPLHHGDRIFKLHGVAKGNVKIQAKQAAVLRAELEVDTKDRKTVKLCFNFVHDSAGHHTVRHTSSARQWVNDVNAIYNGQANVFVTLQGARKVAVASDLGPQVMWDATPTSEWNTVTALGDGVADLNVFLVWEYEQDATPTIDDTNAGTLGGNTILEDNLTPGKRTFVTIGHEMGHHLGAADRNNALERNFLMFGSGDRIGVHLPKADVNTMNP
jgi:hypothetical protein